MGVSVEIFKAAISFFKSRVAIVFSYCCFISIIFPVGQNRNCLFIYLFPQGANTMVM